MYYFDPTLVIEKVLEFVTSTEQWTFVHSLTTFPGLGRDEYFYCPWSEDTKSWCDKYNRDNGAIPNLCKG